MTVATELPKAMARFPTGVLVGDLLEEVGDADPAGLPEVEGRFEGGTDVVRVDVEVPDAVAADHHDRITDLSPGRLERLDAVVGQLEEVHHLVTEVANVAGAVADESVQVIPLPSVPLKNSLPPPAGAWKLLSTVGIGSPSTTCNAESSNSR